MGVCLFSLYMLMGDKVEFGDEGDKITRFLILTLDDEGIKGLLVLLLKFLVPCEDTIEDEIGEEKGPFTFNVFKYPQFMRFIV